MSGEHQVVLQAGQRVDVSTIGPHPDYLHCIKGSAHVGLSRMAVGWSMGAGDGCLLGQHLRYRVIARTATRMTFDLSDGSSFNLVKTGDRT